VNVQFNVNPGSDSAFAQFVVDSIEQARFEVNRAMGRRFYDLVQGNFGIAGVDRPMAWAPLSPAYAKQVGREIATLDLTGALRSAIMIGGYEGEGVTVSISNADVPYATIHQTGGVRMPKRPYFPIDDTGKVLDYTASQVTEAAQKALTEELN
jgi:phage gpG-like protein